MEALLGILVAAAIILGILSGFWWLWCVVLGQLWPTGPEQIINPGFWLFVGMWLLLGFVGRNIFGSKK